MDIGISGPYRIGIGSYSDFQLLYPYSSRSNVLLGGTTAYDISRLSRCISVIVSASIVLAVRSDPINIGLPIGGRLFIV